MAADKNIKKYTAHDIEKYQKGMLSKKEMHEIEKAALDDPFLADAIDGYRASRTDIANDMAELTKRLEEKTNQAKVIQLKATNKPANYWLKIAAVVIIIGGATLLTYKFVFDKKENTVAINQQPKNETVRPADTVSTSVTGAEREKTDRITTPGTENVKKPSKNKTGVNETNKTALPEADNSADFKDLTSDNTTVKNSEPPEEVSKQSEATTTGIRAEPPTVESKVAFENKETAKQVPENITLQKKKAAALSKEEVQSKVNNPQIAFHGWVTDGSNTGVSFANVSILPGGKDTYTDTLGYFTLIASDSLLNVEVRSIGYNNKVTQLKNRKVTNHIVLSKDENSLSEVMIGNKLPNTAIRSRDANRISGEPEPVTGWANYDIYLANNLRIPEEYKAKQSEYPSVEVSFEVDEKGEPVNMKITKSLCYNCDREAFRLIKEGPKWKKNGDKNYRTTVIVNF